MKRLLFVLMKTLKKLVLFIKKNKIKNIDYIEQEASDQIKTAIESGRPLMVARLGLTELNCMSVYTSSNLGIEKYILYLKDELRSFDINNHIIKTAHMNAGVFPPNKDIIYGFSKIMIDSIDQLDILGSFSRYEDYYIRHLKNLKTIRLKDIEPYYHKNPWSKALKNKTVLVIHPFTESIQAQYAKRELLFPNRDILPEFTLKTIKSVQSAAGQKDLPYKDWIEALESMKAKIDQEEFDIAIIGCGAYGFPLAAHVKKIGKQAIHMGGATQILFGIKGERWMKHPLISSLFNEHWVRPNSNETPPDSKKVEDGCYW